MSEWQKLQSVWNAIFAMFLFLKKEGTDTSQSIQIARLSFQSLEWCPSPARECGSPPGGEGIWLRRWNRHWYSKYIYYNSSTENLDLNWKRTERVVLFRGLLILLSTDHKKTEQHVNCMCVLYAATEYF